MLTVIFYNFCFYVLNERNTRIRLRTCNFTILSTNFIIVFIAEVTFLVQFFFLCHVCFVNFDLEEECSRNSFMVTRPIDNIDSIDSVSKYSYPVFLSLKTLMECSKISGFCNNTKTCKYSESTLYALLIKIKTKLSLFRAMLLQNQSFLGL